MVLAVALVGAVVAAGWGLSQRDNGVRAGVLTFGDITDSTISITLEVVRDPNQAVVCDVAAVGDQQLDVGAERAEVPIGGGERAVVTVVIDTASPPLAARLLSCQPVG